MSYIIAVVNPHIRCVRAHVLRVYKMYADVGYVYACTSLILIELRTWFCLVYLFRS